MSPKVMHICLSNGWGGLEMYPSRIIPELRCHGWEVHGLALAGSRVADSLREAGVAPVTVASKGRALFALPRLLAYLTANGIGVLHCHKSSDLRLGSLLVALMPSLKLFFTDHMGVTRPKKDPYHRWAYGRVTTLFSISEATRQRNLAAFPLPAARIQRLYLGIDPAPYTPRLSPPACQGLRDSLEIPRGAVAIGLPGRLTSGKGQAEWIEALGALRNKAPHLDWHGVLIGGLKANEGSDEAYVARLRERVATLGLCARVTFTGFRRDLPRVFEALDLVCVPSRNEAFGLTVIEAMAAGKAVIGADNGAIPELIDLDTGRLASPGDASAWAEAMAELSADEELRATLGAAARQKVRRQFTLHAHVETLCKAYRGNAPDDSGDPVAARDQRDP